MIFYLAVFCFLAALDVVSKGWAVASLPPLQGGLYPFGGIPVFEDFFGVSFSLNYVTNSGAAWGVFHGYAGILFAVRCVLILALLFCALKEPRQRWGWVLILTGAVGNAIDYLVYGHVIDLFHFVFWGYSFPIFNLADSYITVGVVVLLALSLFRGKKVHV